MIVRNLARLTVAGLLAVGLSLTLGVGDARAQVPVPQLRPPGPPQTFVAQYNSQFSGVLFAGPVPSTVGGRQASTVVFFGPTRQLGTPTGTFALQYTRLFPRTTRRGFFFFFDDDAAPVTSGVWFQTFFDGQGGLAAVTFGAVPGGVQGTSFFFDELTVGLRTLGGVGPSLNSVTGAGTFDGFFFSQVVDGIDTPTFFTGDIFQQQQVSIRQPFTFR